MEKYLGAILLKNYAKFMDKILPKFDNPSLVKVAIPSELEHELYFKYSGIGVRFFTLPIPEDFWFALDRVYVDSKEAYDIAKNMGVKNIDYDFSILAEVKAASPIIENKFEEEIKISPKVAAKLNIEVPKEEPKKEEIAKPKPEVKPEVEAPKQEVKKTTKGRK